MLLIASPDFDFWIMFSNPMQKKNRTKSPAGMMIFTEASLKYLVVFLLFFVQFFTEVKSCKSINVSCYYPDGHI